MKGKLNEVVKQFLIQSNKQFFRSKFMDNSDIGIPWYRNWLDFDLFICQVRRVLNNFNSQTKAWSTSKDLRKANVGVNVYRVNQLNFEVDNNECLYSLKNDSTKTFGKRHVLKDFYDFIKLIVTLGQYTPKKKDCSYIRINIHIS